MSSPIHRQVTGALVAPDHVTILGLGPSLTEFVEVTKRLGGASAYCDEVWAINGAGDIFATDLIFHMDDVRVQEMRAAAAPTSNIAAMMKWIKRHPGPIMTSRKVEGYPGLVEFPLEAVQNKIKGAQAYFNNTAAYAIAYAILIGVKRLSLYGIDFTMANVHTAEGGRGCCEFWLGIASALGIEIMAPETSSLLDACLPDDRRFYGYDFVDVHLQDRDDGSVAVTFADREPERIVTAEEIERRYDHRRNPNPMHQKKEQ